MVKGNISISNGQEEFGYFRFPKFSTEIQNLGQTEQLQFRVAVDFNNNGKTPKNVYFDDIEFIK